MSNGAQAPERTGLHPLAWVGIGCGAILMVIVIAVVMVGGFFLARTVKDVAEDFEDNPGLAAARFIVKASPELEEVEVDEDAGTMTVRNTQDRRAHHGELRRHPGGSVQLDRRWRGE